MILLVNVSTPSRIMIKLLQVSAHYSADPYKLLDQLKKMNLKHIKVAYGANKKKNSAIKKEEKKVIEQEVILSVKQMRIHAEISKFVYHILFNYAGTRS